MKKYFSKNNHNNNYKGRSPPWNQSLLETYLATGHITPRRDSN